MANHRTKETIAARKKEPFKGRGAKKRNAKFKGVPTKLTELKKEQFIEHLAKHKNVAAAATAIGVSRRYMYYYRKQDKEFADKWKDAWNSVLDQLESSLMERAINGYQREMYQQGEMVGTQTVHDSNLGMFLLKAHRPEVYSDKVNVQLSAAEYADEIRKFLESMDKSAKDAIKEE